MTQQLETKDIEFLRQLEKRAENNPNNLVTQKELQGGLQTKANKPVTLGPQ